MRENTTAEERMRAKCQAAQQAYDDAARSARITRDAVIYEAEGVYLDALVAANRARHEAIAEAQHAYSDAIQGPRIDLAEEIEVAEQEYYAATPHLRHPLRRIP